MIGLSTFQFGGHDWMALPQGALFWPARRALIVADLHFEKASAYAVRGQMLPPYDSLATLAALDQAIRATQAREVWCLGDSFHDHAAAERMTREARACLARTVGDLRWTWITGNHDPAPDSRLGGAIMPEAQVDGVILRHEALASEAAPEISGHFHPKLRMSRRGRAVSRRCFLRGARKLILPAFGALTGGLDAGAPALRSLFGEGCEALVPVPDRLLRFALP